MTKKSMQLFLGIVSIAVALTAGPAGSLAAQQLGLEAERLESR
jgi:hypothetical protein